jgi:hypothetical protein
MIFSISLCLKCYRTDTEFTKTKISAKKVSSVSLKALKKQEKFE